MSKITIIGIGPGSEGDMTAAAIDALRRCRALVGYSYYLPFVRKFLDPDTELYTTGMHQEVDRLEKAFAIAAEGGDVCVISSGDAGIYGMAPLALEMADRCGRRVDVEVIPGISAFQKAAAILGAPMGHDFCVISLSDLLTPWAVIEKRIRAAADADFVTAIYNPRSHGRYWQLHRLREIFLESRPAGTPVGYVRQAGRDGETSTITTLGDFNPDDIDMFTIVIIGNTASFESCGRFVTPRGYYSASGSESADIGRDIMTRSFQTIEKELSRKDIPLGLKWPLLHAIHTTADFEMERLLKVDEDAVEKIYVAITRGADKTIVTDVTMCAAGIRKGALARLGVKAECYLNGEGIAEQAASEGITRTQAAIRRAVEEHPEALYVFGNAPTALMELSRLIRLGKARPCGIVAAPVGFVHVCESKHGVKPFTSIPKIIVEGRKGGSNLAATLVNAILCWPDAAALKPGRDV